MTQKQSKTPVTEPQPETVPAGTPFSDGDSVATPPDVLAAQVEEHDTEAEAVEVIEALAEQMMAAGRQAAAAAKAKPRYRDRYAGPLVQDAYTRCARMVRDLIDADPDETAADA